MQETTRIGLRIKAARQRAGLTQQQFADSLGLKHRQIVGRMEDGRRAVSAEEFIRAMDLLGVDLDYFTDPFRLEGEGEFTFRTSPGASSAVVDEFERRAGRWMAVYRELSREQGRKTRWLELKLALSPHCSLRDAEDAGEEFVDRMGLGACPADALRSVMEDRLGILVLAVESPLGISAAASRIRGLNCVLVDRGAPDGGRNFNLAYALFHLLTWDAIPPERTESSDVPRRGKGWRVERMAERFASALLMPWPSVRERWGFGLSEPMLEPADMADPHDLLNHGAVELRVPVMAYKRRLRDLRVFSREEVDALDDRRLVASGRPPRECPRIPLFSREFVRCVAIALDGERLSARRAASLLDLSLPQLASLLNAHGHEAAFEP